MRRNLLETFQNDMILYLVEFFSSQMNCFLFSRSFSYNHCTRRLEPKRFYAPDKDLTEKYGRIGRINYRFVFKISDDEISCELISHIHIKSMFLLLVFILESFSPKERQIKDNRSGCHTIEKKNTKFSIRLQRRSNN